MNAITQTSETKGQIRQIETVGSYAIASILEGLNLTKDGAQRVLESNEFLEGMKDAAHIALSSLLVTDKYANKEVRSKYPKYGYLSGYETRPIAEQVGPSQKAVSTAKRRRYTDPR